MATVTLEEVYEPFAAAPFPPLDGSGVVAGSDDAYEILSTGEVIIDSTSIPLGGLSGAGSAICGFRFDDLQIPQGSNLLTVFVQFVAAAPSSGACVLELTFEASTTPSTYTEATGNISSRPQLGGRSWAVPDWLAVDDAGPAQLTPDVSGYLDFLVQNPGWTLGSGFSVFIESTSGRRDAFTYERDPARAPHIVITYS